MINGALLIYPSENRTPNTSQMKIILNPPELPKIWQK